MWPELTNTTAAFVVGVIWKSILPSKGRRPMCASYRLTFFFLHYRLYSRRHGHPRLSEDDGLSNLQQGACSYRSTTIRIFTRTPASISVHSVRGSKGASVEWLGGKRGPLSRAIRHITASARRVNGCCRNDPAVQEGGGGVEADRILVVTFHPLYDHGSRAGRGGVYVIFQRGVMRRGRWWDPPHECYLDVTGRT